MKREIPPLKKEKIPEISVLMLNLIEKRQPSIQSKLEKLDLKEELIHCIYLNVTDKGYLMPTFKDGIPEWLKTFLQDVVYDAFNQI